ncbi:hypothetical protein, partial [Pseudomonas sp. GM67]|uniref:hypothetical protein n=1 Tax=Pseudomonas sp. GM67 TaxID=1144335 RepID=UPI001EE6824A
TKGAKALGYLALFQVTRRKGETNSRHHRSNGYAPPPNPKKSQLNSMTTVRYRVFSGSVIRAKKRASRLFDGEKVEPLRLKMHVKQAVSLVGVQITHHLRNRSS